MPRLFTGLEIPAEIGRHLSSFRGGLPGARWIDPENYHITLRFIGDIDEGVARDVFSVLGDSRRRGPVGVTIDGLDTFGGGRPRAVLARAAATSEINELQSEQERLVRRVGLPPERRKFVPHVTLARLRDASPIDVAGYIATRGHFPKLSFTARALPEAVLHGAALRAVLVAGFGRRRALRGGGRLPAGIGARPARAGALRTEAGAILRAGGMAGLRGIEPELPTHAKRERVEVAEIERRGGCACGQLTFHTRGEPLRVGLCHCLTCRKTSGSAFNAFAIFPDDRVEITGAMEGWRASPDSERCFCPRCGSQVLAREGGETEIRLGAFDEPNLFTPTYEAWIGRRERWLRLPGLTGYPRNRLDGTPGAPSEA